MWQSLSHAQHALMLHAEKPIFRSLTGVTTRRLGAGIVLGMPISFVPSFVLPLVRCTLAGFFWVLVGFFFWFFGSGSFSLVFFCFFLFLLLFEHFNLNFFNFEYFL
jgi:pheromone shutdown protein TraB